MLKKATNFLKSHIGSDREDQFSQEDVTGIPAVCRVPYFYGRISREQAENILTERDTRNGSYLLRDSLIPFGNYSFSMMHKGRCIHYSLQKEIDGRYTSESGEIFNDPLEFIEFYSSNPGFLTPPIYPCDRKADEEPIAFHGISYAYLHNHMKKAARKMNASLVRALGILHEPLMLHVLSTMHEMLPWYHGDINRAEAAKRLAKAGLEDGTFLVRRRRTGPSYAISMCHWGAVVNYVIYETDGGTYNINNGPIFKALVLVIDYYQHQHCGLVRNLYMPCCEPSYNATSWEKYKRVYTMYGNLHLINEEYSDDELNEKSLPSPTKDSKKGSSIKREPISHSAQGRDSGMKCSDAVYDETDAGWIETEAENTYKPILRRTMTEEDALDLENTYTEIRPDVLNLPLRPEDVKLTEKLGSGQFGEVMKGTCMLGRTEVPVAVKTLKNQDPDGEKEIQSEANLMKKLDHKHIVRMIGICKGKTIMLVMELAELGPLNGYLNTQKVDRLKQWHLLEIAKQICDGMQYLESMDVVHRDLATRNVLLLNEHFAKISDFGMSRMVDSESDCYTSHVHGKWPLMWYAPECEKYRRFDSKSDVWSYGVTLWEIMSYGARPYPDMKIGEIRQFLDAGNRMAKPEDCDNRIYTDIMRACWEYEKTHRPSFKELLPLLERLFREFIHQNE